jgi:hypothetical protein
VPIERADADVDPATLMTDRAARPGAPAIDRAVVTGRRVERVESAGTWTVGAGGIIAWTEGARTGTWIDVVGGAGTWTVGAGGIVAWTEGTWIDVVVGGAGTRTVGAGGIVTGTGTAGVDTG